MFYRRTPSCLGSLPVFTGGLARRLTLCCRHALRTPPSPAKAFSVRFAALVQVGRYSIALTRHRANTPTLHSGSSSGSRPQITMTQTHPGHLLPLPGCTVHATASAGASSGLRRHRVATRSRRLRAREGRRFPEFFRHAEPFRAEPLHRLGRGWRKSQRPPPAPILWLAQRDRGRTRRPMSGDPYRLPCALRLAAGTGSDASPSLRGQDPGCRRRRAVGLPPAAASATPRPRSERGRCSTPRC